ncbi:MAG: tetratricopeptide repeat protein [Planctomycetota bacterium]
MFIGILSVFSEKEGWSWKEKVLVDMINDMKNLIILWLLLAIQCLPLYAQEKNLSANWSKQDSKLFEELKKEHKLDDAQTYQLMGLAFLHQDFWEKASLCLEKAVKLNPKLYISWYYLGLIHINTEEGFNYFKKATEANPDFSPPYYWMAYYKCRARQDKEAITLFQKYLEVAKKDESETGRIKVAEEVLQDLLTGREGEQLKIMRGLE